MSTNLKISLNLKKLKNVGVMDVKGRESTQRCIVIPIEANNIFISDKGAYLDIVGFEMKNPGDKKETHLLKQSLPKEVYEKMTQADKDAQPLVGNATVSAWSGNSSSGSSSTAGKSATEVAHSGASADDLPF